MSRKAPVITMDDFKQIVGLKLMNQDGDLKVHEFPEKINKDLQKVEFDFENYEWQNGRGLGGGEEDCPCGFETLSNGLPILWVNAGGDWEAPVVFILYWDGKDLRAYIPKEGNTWNPKTKAAWGNGEDEYDEDAPNVNKEKLVADIIDRVKLV